jgi:hypothetical protein
MKDETEDWEITGEESEVELSKKKTHSSLNCVRGKKIADEDIQ